MLPCSSKAIINAELCTWYSFFSFQLLLI